MTHTTGRPWGAEETRGFRGSGGPHASLATHTHGQRGSEGPGPRDGSNVSCRGAARGTLWAGGSRPWQGEQCCVWSPGRRGDQLAERAPGVGPALRGREAEVRSPLCVQRPALQPWPSAWCGEGVRTGSVIKEASVSQAPEGQESAWCGSRGEGDPARLCLCAGFGGYSLPLVEGGHEGEKARELGFLSLGSRNPRPRAPAAGMGVPVRPD